MPSQPCLLSINNYFYPRGGAEVVFLEQNRLLEGVGWQVVPFAMRHPQNLPTPWADYFPDEIEFGRSYGLATKLLHAQRVIYSVQARKRMRALLAHAASAATGAWRSSASASTSRSNQPATASNLPALVAGIAAAATRLASRSVSPVADVLSARGTPFVFVTGYGVEGIPEAYRDRPTLKKPFQIDGLKRVLEAGRQGAGVVKDTGQRQ